MARNASFSTLFTTLCFVTFIHLFVFHPIVEGTSFHLIHRDSPKSPYYNSSISHYERLNNAFHRSFSRAASLTRRTLYDSNFCSGGPEIESDILNGEGDFLMELSVGTPPFQIVAIADTGSDFTWTQCLPCPECYKQNAPLFDPSKSKTYKDLSCKSNVCKDLQSTCDKKSNCEYRNSFDDGSYSIGNVATETITFRSIPGKNVSFPNVVIGCGHENDGGNFDASASGKIGLGGGKYSLVSQMGSAGGKFSYCLLPKNSDRKIHSDIKFGENALVSGPGTVSTPIIKKNSGTFYYLTLKSITVGDVESNTIDLSTAVNPGNIIIDSGTTLTSLPRQIYSDLIKLLKDEIHCLPVADPEGLFQLCYESDADIIFPELVFHFDGADVSLSGTNTFAKVSNELICFMMVPTNGQAIYGNLAQMDFLIGFDQQKKKVSFKPTDCTKHNH